MRRGGLISRNIPLILVVLGLSIAMQVCHKENTDYTKYVKEPPPVQMPVREPIPTQTPKKGQYQDPNDPAFADPTDLQAEDEGQYEDKHQDFNPTQK